MGDSEIKKETKQNEPKKTENTAKKGGFFKALK